jgi:hypothetical protein
MPLTMSPEPGTETEVRQAAMTTLLGASAAKSGASLPAHRFSESPFQLQHWFRRTDRADAFDQRFAVIRSLHP